MPSPVPQICKPLIGKEITVITWGGNTLTGTLIKVAEDGNGIKLHSKSEVYYIDTAHVSAVIVVRDPFDGTED